MTEGTSITITPVNNGWVVKAGCMTLVFNDPGLIAGTFSDWIRNRRETEEYFIRKYQRDPMGEIAQTRDRGEEVHIGGAAPPSTYDTLGGPSRRL